MIKKRGICIASFFLLLTIAITANPLQDSLTTSYNKGQFQTRCTLKTKGTKEVASAIATYFISDLYHSPGHLFEWAFKDLGLQQKNNDVIIIFKSSFYDTKTGIISGIFDIDVTHIKTFRDIRVDVKVTQIRYTNGTIKLTANILNSGFLLNKATGTLLLIPQKNNNLQITATSEITFGWFFNLFITQQRYKGIVEWRIRKFAHNIAAECGKKTTDLTK